ncbi:MAG: Ig-like domain-containing protein, partial [Pirellulales bacterium]|nr:Ig-like domain-containing protein [Pirellulales bacterium]
QPANGTLVHNADGSFTYDPNLNFFGNDTFTYVASDGLLQSNVATVTLQVVGTNDPPVSADDHYTVLEDNVLTVNPAGVLANDTDPDFNSLTAEYVIGSGPANGILQLNANGSFTYTPNANYFGSDQFEYRATDGEFYSSIGTVTIDVLPVNDPPDVVTDSYAVDEDTVLTVNPAGVLSNDSDIENEPLTAVKVSDPAHGTVLLAADGSFTYTPDADYHGPDEFVYKANDGTDDSAPETVSITVNPINDAPVSQADVYDFVFRATTAEQLVVAASGVLANDSDVDLDSLTAVEVSATSNGTLVLAANGSFTYTPNAGFSGSDSFTYQASDSLLNSATTTVTINVRHAPVAGNVNHSVDEDQSLVIAAPGVLANTTDVESDPLTATLATNATFGTVSVNLDGSFTYTPVPNFFGNDSFTFLANDGTDDSNEATVSITVNSVNDAPTTVNDDYVYVNDVSGQLSVSAAAGVLANDSDVENDLLTASLQAGAANGTVSLQTDGSFVYTPNPGFVGTDTFTYQASDPSAGATPGTVTIQVTNAPVAVADNYSLVEDTVYTAVAPGVLANDSDPDLDPITAVLENGPATGSLTLNADGSFTYTPATDFVGDVTFTYRASDSLSVSDIATVTLSVVAVNDAPVANVDNYSVSEDNVLNVLAAGVLTNDVDVDGDSLTAVQVSNPSHGTATLQSDGSLVYTPDANFHGTDSFTYHANDGLADSANVQVLITVDPINDMPTSVNDNYTASEDVVFSANAALGVLANDSDIDGDPLTVSLVANGTNGTAVLHSDGSFSYTPNLNYVGTDTFTYVAFDGAANSVVGTVTMTVNAVNDAPVAGDNSYTTVEDQPLTVAAAGLLTDDTDIENDPLTAVKVSDPLNGSVVINSDGSFTYTPAANFNGTDTFTYRANDGSLNSNDATVTVTVTAENDAPIGGPDSYTTDEDVVLTVNAAAGVINGDIDVEGDPITVSLVTGT